MKSNRYTAIVEETFHSRFRTGQRAVALERDDIVRSATKLGIEVPKNLGDLIYAFRYQQKLPLSISDTAPEGETWIIRSAGTSKYRFALVTDAPLAPNRNLTTVRGLGQVETDEIYVGLDKRGSHYVVPVQAKGGSDRLSRIQIEQDLAVCAEKLPSLICQPVGLQLMRNDLIAPFAFEQDGDEINVVSEKHYQLVPPDEDLARYRRRLSDTT